MIRTVVGGATGRLGSLVCDLIAASNDIELIGAIVSENGGNVGKELYPGVVASKPKNLPHILKNADVYVDLTSPESAAKIIPDIPKNNVALVLGTTSVPQASLDSMAENVSRYGTSAVVTSNFAVGVNIFWKIVGQMAAMMKDYDIEIIDIHHSGKKDSPSGTAKETLKRIQEATGLNETVYGRCGMTGRGKEIGVHSVRAGNVVGDHTVLFAGNMETLALSHSAVSREAFANGCIECIRWINGKKDGKVHSMTDVLGI